ncbi:hypothetical protein PR202_ga16824 [Eleusine coracana subsp. coracana]|uniref:type I protein arginine methyltransferase n=1 Tax=Eleusine coracana subsp. coracana TaxID=191504 RepID=A0AAV5CNV1_ELECO|nr:hypothetical protein PR202_ga16824 [Eleusine coracana subsp. coracana]
MECSRAGKKEAEERVMSAEEEEEGEEGWDDWCSDDDDAAAAGGGLLCLFCSSRFDAEGPLFSHCATEHRFDFYRIVKELGLDFYGCIKLINFVRSKVAENSCWSLHPVEKYQIEGNVPWDDDIYLKPFMEDDSLLHSLSIDDDDDEDCGTSIERGQCSPGNGGLAEPCKNKLSAVAEGNGSYMSARFEQVCAIGSAEGGSGGTLAQEQSDTQLKVARASVNAKTIKTVDDNYFGSYSSFGIHREMLGDKIRTEAYRDALLCNPSLMNGATVLDVGCGTGILSLFAAKAGASRVVAVDGSAKMVSVATQVAKNNGLLNDDENKVVEQKKSSQVVSVTHTKAEELSHKVQIPPGGFDVLVSEWMGYCLLYESMLSSVLYARDHFLKPGGAILPDTATISDISCISAFMQSFDLATMKETEMDFTASFELRFRESGVAVPEVTWCYGIVLWFDTGFTDRFCKEKPVILSTSPFSTPTHWSQTIFTFEEPIAMVKEECLVSPSASVGTEKCPAVMIRSRISIVRASEHRSIDISMETTAISSDGQKLSWPVQIFNL